MARLARVMPVVPPAPTTFSITNGWPSVFDMWSPTMRAMTSVGPPAANGTIMVIGAGRIVLRCGGRDADCERNGAGQQAGHGSEQVH